MNVKKYIGLKWIELTQEQQEELLNSSYIEYDKDKCILNFNKNLSIEAKVENGKYIINDNSMFYNPEKGIMQEHEIWQDLISLADAARLYNRDDSVLRRAIANRTFVPNVDCMKFGKQWVFRKESLEKVYSSK